MTCFRCCKQTLAFWTAPFLPNLLNTVVFLVQTSQMISVFFANYKVRHHPCHAYYSGYIISRR